MAEIISTLISKMITKLLDWIGKRNKADEMRKKILLRLLENPKYEWRSLTTLMRAIGADEKTTKKLLVEIGARASIKPVNGKEVWGLIKRVG